MQRKQINWWQGIVIATAFMLFSVDNAIAATRTTFQGQLIGLARQVRKSLQDNPLVEGQRLQLVAFEGLDGAELSNFGLRIEQALRTELDDDLVAQSRLRLTGSYQFAASADRQLKSSKILLITAKIIDDRDREIVSFATEVNDTDNIMQVLGLTGAASQDPQASIVERNLAAQNAVQQPSFTIVDQRRVAADTQSTFSVGVRTKENATGTGREVRPESVNGLAYVPIAIGEYYEIVLANTDTIDVVATITVDGLDVANAFSVDQDANGKRAIRPGYLVPAGKQVVVRGWLRTVDQKASDNLYSFRVDELGKGAASAMRTRGTVGVITVQFREACAPQGRLSGRSFGETARGESLQEKLFVKSVQIGENVLSTVSIRYNRPSAGPRVSLRRIDSAEGLFYFGNSRFYQLLIIGTADYVNSEEANEIVKSFRLNSREQ
jgi:hypothetical protein